MRKSKKTKATFDAIGSLTPEEAGELLSAGLNSSMIDRKIHETVDWKNHDLPSYPDIFIGDPPGSLGCGGSTRPYGPTIISPTIGIGSGTISAVSISDLEDRIKKLEDQAQEHAALIAMLRVELAEAKRRGGFWRRPNI